MKVVLSLPKKSISIPCSEHIPSVFSKSDCEVQVANGGTSERPFSRKRFSHPCLVLRPPASLIDNRDRFQVQRDQTSLAENEPARGSARTEPGSQEVLEPLLEWTDQGRKASIIDLSALPKKLCVTRAAPL